MSTEIVVAVEDYDHVPSFDEITVTAQQIEVQRERWPDDSESRLVWRAKMKVMATVRHRLERNPDGSPKFGGTQKGAGRPSKRLGEAFKEWADENHAKVIEALAAGLDKNEDPKDRHKAAVNILKQRMNEDKIDMKEREYEGLNRDDLTTAFVNAVSKRLRDGDPQVKAMLQGALAAMSDQPAEPDTVEVKAIQS